MHDDEDTAAGVRLGMHLSKSGAWATLMVVLGLSLWAQIFALALLEQLHFADHSLEHTLVYLLPVAVMVAGVLTRLAPLTLLGFLVCLVPGMLLLPERSMLDLQQTSSMLRIGVTLAAFVAAAAVASSPTQTVGQDRSPQDAAGGATDNTNKRRIDGIYPLYFTVRMAILVALLWVVQWATFRDPAIAASIAHSYGDKPHTAAIFIGLSAFFAWCVAAYTMFFVPLMNLEYDVRKLSRSIDAMVDGGQRARWKRIGASTTLGAAAVIVAWVLS